MCVTKRCGEREPVDVNKIVRAVTLCCACSLESPETCEACQ